MPALDELASAIGRAGAAYHAALDLACYAPAEGAPLRGLFGNVRTTGVELARLLLKSGATPAAVREGLRADVTRTAARTRCAAARVTALHAVLDQVLHTVLDTA
jgi:hypothetical protein